jgi:hypothetical protein
MDRPIRASGLIDLVLDLDSGHMLAPGEAADLLQCDMLQLMSCYERFGHRGLLTPFATAFVTFRSYVCGYAKIKPAGVNRRAIIRQSIEPSNVVAVDWTSRWVR